MVTMVWVSGFGGLVVSMLTSGTQDCGFEAVRFFRRKNPEQQFSGLNALGFIKRMYSGKSTVQFKAVTITVL
jgi:hypothetical protein